MAHSPALTKPKPLPKPEPEPVKEFKAHDFKPVKPFQPRIQHRVLEVPDFRLPGDEISQRKKEKIMEVLKAKEMEKQEQKVFRAQAIVWEDPTKARTSRFHFIWL